MVQKLLSFFMVNRIQRYYFINFLVVSLTFCVFHFQGTNSFIQTSDWPFGMAVACLVFAAMYILATWRFINKDPTKDPILQDFFHVTIWMPLLVLTIVSVLALVSSLIEKDDPDWLAILSLLWLILYGIRFIITMIYVVLKRFYFDHNFFVRAVERRLNSALGSYRLSPIGTVVTVCAGALIVGLLALSALNSYLQYLLAFTLAQAVAITIQKMLGSGVIHS